MIRRGSTLLGAVALIAGFGGMNASAQSVGASALPTEGLDEVIVTARKRTEVLRNIPVQASAITAEQIANLDLTSIEKIGATTPQLTVGRAPNGSGARITMRGIGASPTSIGIEQSVAVIVDGVYFGQGRVVSEAFFDLDHVEILRGPQALFFGKNATAGVISITSADPAETFGGTLRAAYEFGAEEAVADAVLSAPLGDALSARLALRVSDMSKGYFENRAIAQPDNRLDVATSTVSALTQPAPSVTDTPAAREAMGRLTIAYEPTDRLKVVLKANGTWEDTRGGGYNNVIFSCRTGVSSLNPATPCRRDFVTYTNDMPPDIAATLPFAKDGALYNSYRSSSVTGAITYRLESADLSLVTNYQGNRNTWAIAGDHQSSARPTFATEDSTWRAGSAEFRALSTLDGPLNGLLGFYVQINRREFGQWVSFPGLANSAAINQQNRYVGFSKDSQTDGETLSPYFQLIWNPIDRVELTAGARYTHETKDSFFVHPYVNPTLTAVVIPGNTTVADQSFSNLSPEATITWRATDDVTLYGGYKTAYKSGGFSNSGIYSARGGVENFVFRPEKAEGFEAGLKARLLDGRMQFNLGVFNYEYDGLQVDFFNSIIFAFVTTNAGAAKTQGVEMDFTWSPAEVEGVNIRGSLNFNKAEYLDFLAPCYNGQTPAAGCTLVAEGGVPGQQLAGAATAIAPDWTSTLGFDYTVAVTDALQVSVSVDGRYSSAYLASGFGNPLTYQPPFATLDARASIGAADDSWRLALVGKNLTNEFYLTSAGDGPSTGSGTGTSAGQTADQIGLIAPPRTVFLELSYRY